MKQADQEDFRTEVRRFCALNLPKDLRERVYLNEELGKADYVRWQKILHAKGWFGGHWPVEWGGLGWSRVQRIVFEDELGRAGAPWLIPFGITYVGPVIYTFGTLVQKQRYLPSILTSETWWCQGYSEPGAGSDLANIKTRARRVGDSYRVSGQKIWTTMAHWADMMFALVRTSDEERKQRGISFLLIDMRSPGITVRPIIGLDGRHELNEVFFDDVVVPAENLVGQEGAGWTYAKFLLGNERLLGAEIGRNALLRNKLVALLDKTRGASGKPLSEDPIWSHRLAEIDISAVALESLAHKLLSEIKNGEDPGARASMIKILGSELCQEVTRASMEVAGLYGLRSDDGKTEPVGLPGITRTYLFDRVKTIYGGSSEIQRNIIAKAELGL